MAKNLLIPLFLSLSLLELAKCLTVQKWNGKLAPRATLQHHKLREFVCQSDGFYPVSGQCTSDYYECVEGISNLQTCSTGNIFDPVTYECTASDQASCKQNYDCTNKDGVFAYPSGCAQFYYVCNAGVSYVQFCPDNYVFDPEILKCMQFENASCTPGPTTPTPETTTEQATTKDTAPSTITEAATQPSTTTKGHPTHINRYNQQLLVKSVQIKNVKN